MKDLTDYFASPAIKTKTDLKTVEETTNDSLVVVVDKVTDDSKETLKKESKASRDVANSAENKTKVVPKKTKKDKRRKRKSDPAVKNITELLSNSLSIISPNSSFTKTADITKNGSIVESEVKLKDGVPKKRRGRKRTDEVRYEKEDKCVKIQNEEEAGNSGFQKESDLKVSLPIVECVKGKSLENETEESVTSQRHLAGKLNAFQFMMESRNKSIGQNSPGKDAPENDIGTEDEKVSKEKLSARKNVLQNWAEKKGASKRKRDEEEKDEIINHKLKKRARRLKKLLQVDEDAFKDVILKNKRKRIKKVSSSSESSTDSVVVIDEQKQSLINSVLDTIEENAQDRVLNGTKIKKSNRTLLNFFGAINNANKATENNNQIDEGSNEKKKIKTPIVEGGKSRLSLRKKEKLSKKIVIEENTSEQPIMEIKLKTPKQKKSINECSRESRENPITPKNKILDENEESLTPRSLKSWKMKIKISADDVERKDENKANKNRNSKARRTKRNTSVNYEDNTSDASSNEGKFKTVLEQNEVIQEIILSSDDDCKENSNSQTNKLLKIAPVFVKATPKPKLAPELLEAKKQFLMSGIPISLKKAMEKQQSVEEKDYEIFPSTSHVQQKCETQLFWNLPKPQLNLKEYSPLKTTGRESCNGITNSQIANKFNIQTEVDKVDNLKTLLNKIKADNPSYPVYKSFRLIYEKSGKISEKQKEKTASTKRQKSKKRRSKNLDKSIEIIDPEKQETDSVEYAMWTDKYKPKCSDDIIGNAQGVRSLKKWLETWMNFSQEINAKKKKRRTDYSSGSDFETTDCDSRDSTKLPGNTVVLGGPCGSGKSVSLYAICNELGFNVIELNSSSKRTGKRLLQELQEATRSHQVRKGDQNNFFQTGKPKETAESKERRMCVLLIEDVDIVFEQDDGFISALSQLISTSKRPIIMTTTDSSSVYVQRFVSQYEYISFMPLSSQSLAAWLQIVCLVEGLFVNQDDIGSLLEYNRGDVRKTLLQLQFWVQSGGQINRDKAPVKIVNKRSSTEKMADDEHPLSCIEDNDDKKMEVFSHSNCIISFEIFRDYKQYRVPYYLNLGLVWWNIPNILNMPNFSHRRRNKFSGNDNKTEPLEVDSCKEKSKLCCNEEKTKLDILAKLYECLAFTDISFRKIRYFDGIEPIVKNISVNIKDSLELGECMDGYNVNSEFVHELTHTVVNGYVELYNAVEKDESILNMSVPEKAERRWRAKHHVCQDVFEEALPLSTYMDRKSMALDYMPSLRDISRSERLRAANNTKRGNRFRNYLRDLNIKYNDNTVKLACNILAVDEF